MRRSKSRKVVKVRKGESLARVAKRFGVSAGELAEINGLDDGAKLVTAPPIATALPQAVNPGVNPAVNPTVIPNPVNPAAPTTIRTLPQRTMRLPAPPGVQPQAGAVGGGAGGAVYTGVALPNQQPQPGQMTVEQQALMIEVQRLKYQQEGNPMAKILPPTPITPRTEGGEPQAQ